MPVITCESLIGNWPHPPANAMAMSAFHSSDADLRWDDPADLNTSPDIIETEPPVTASVTLVLNGPVTEAAPSEGNFLITGAPVPAGSAIGIDGVAVISVAGPAVGPDEFDGSSLDFSILAQRIAAAINAGSPSAWGLVTATAVGGTVALVSKNTGGGCNQIILSSNTPTVTPDRVAMSGGTDQTQVTVNRIPFTAKNGPADVAGRNFDLNDPLSSLAEAINDPSNGDTRVTAYHRGGCLVLEARVTGYLGNKIPVESNSASLVPSAPYTDGGRGLACTPWQDNSVWNILGVNIYRSDTGERGPYFRVNRVPVGATFYRDRTDVAEVPDEVIPWEGGWVFKGDAPNGGHAYRIRTRYRPLVKREGNAIPANSPFDVEVWVDGERVPVEGVFGETGEIDLSMTPVWDPVTETWEAPPVPNENSAVVVRYQYLRLQKLENTLDRRFKVFYRIATVALDPTGASPTGLVETPLEYCPPVSPMETEQLDYIWKEAIYRNRWILEQGGERVKLFIRRMNGQPCRCHWDPRLLAYSKQPINNCLTCYGTGWIGGYEGPYDIIIGPDESDRRVSQTPNGRRLENSYEVWIGPTPMVSQRDFIVKQNGERFSIGPVRRTQIRGRTLQQAFTIGYLDTSEIRYRVPMGPLEQLPWPQTRFTNPNDAPCEESVPHPIGADYQATPMATEAPKIPDRREQRGRTPVWQNITYGGRG